MTFRYSHLYITTMSGKRGKSKSEGFRLKGRVWIEGREGTFLGYGRVVLLERIKQFGSISEAAKSMNMSYRHAWELVDSMNRQVKNPLVETATGGKGGGGARLTEAGEKAIEAFWKLYRDFNEFLEKTDKSIKFT
ncbi:MAG: LysR family transcriptional regulator [Thermodesulfovibrionales bacterium]|nr:LysR family transcriptional regulator [Thermodesulfovibrionales bacterium]